jgi:hypothetical protein
MKFFTVWSKLRFGLIYNLKDPSLVFYFFFLKNGRRAKHSRKYEKKEIS